MNFNYLKASLFLTASTVYLQVLVPFAFLRVVSSETFATWAFWFSILSYLALGDLGTISLAQYRSLKSIGELAGRPTAYITTLTPILAIISAAILAVVVVLAMVSIVPTFFAIMAAVPLLQLQTRVASILYRRRGTFHRYCYAASLANFAFPPLILVTAWEGIELTVIAALYLAVNVLMSLGIIGASGLWASAVLSWRSYKRLFGSQAQTCATYVVLSLVPTVLNTGPILLLGALFQPAQLVQFYAARIIANLGVVVANSVYSSNMPDLVDRRRSKRDIDQTIINVLKLVTGFFVLQIAVAFLFRDLLETYWLNGRVELATPFLQIAMLSAFCASLIYFSINTFQAFGTPSRSIHALLAYGGSLAIVLAVFWGPLAGPMAELGAAARIALVVVVPTVATALVSLTLGLRVIRLNSMAREAY